MTFTLGLWFVVFTVVIVTRLVGPIERPQSQGPQNQGPQSQVDVPTLPNPFGSGQFANPAGATPRTSAVPRTLQNYTEVVFGTLTDSVPSVMSLTGDGSSTQPSTTGTSTSHFTNDLNSNNSNQRASAEPNNVPKTSKPVQVNIPETVLPIAPETLSSMLLDSSTHSPPSGQATQAPVTGPLELFPTTITSLDANELSLDTQLTNTPATSTNPPSNITNASTSRPNAARIDPVNTVTPEQLTLLDVDNIVTTNVDVGNAAITNVDRASTDVVDVDASNLATLDVELAATLSDRAFVPRNASEDNLVDSFVAASQINQAQNTTPPSAVTTRDGLSADQSSTRLSTVQTTVHTPDLDARSLEATTSTEDTFKTSVVSHGATLTTSHALKETTPVVPSAIEAAQTVQPSPVLAQPTSATVEPSVDSLADVEITDVETIAKTAARAPSSNTATNAPSAQDDTQLATPLPATLPNSTREVNATSFGTVRVSPPPLLPVDLLSPVPSASAPPASTPPASTPPAPTPPASTPSKTAATTTTETEQTPASSATVTITLASDPAGAEVITDAGVIGVTPLVLELPQGSELNYTLAVPETLFGSNFRRFSSVLQAREDSTISVWLDRISDPPRPVEGFGTTRFVGTPAASPEAVKELRETLESMLVRSQAEYQNALEEVQLGALEAEIDALENELARLDALSSEGH
jgi:hypothetical protein